MITSTKSDSSDNFTFTSVNNQSIITGAIAPIKATLKIPTSINDAQVIAIEATAFDGLKIEAFEVEDNSTAFKTIDGVLYTKDSSELIAYPKARRDDFLKVPDCVRSIGKLALSRAQNLKGIDLNQVQTIKHSGLRGCTRLEKLIIGEAFLGLEAFSLGFCTRLSHVEFPSCDSISDWSFAATFRLKSLYFHEGIPKRVALYAFADAGGAETSVVFSNGDASYKISELGPDFVAAHVNKEVSI